MKEFMIAPIILFVIFVAPVWVVMHYRFKTKMIKGISDQELDDFEHMLEKLDKLSDRLETLEKILDEEHPSWRSEGAARDKGDQL